MALWRRSLQLRVVTTTTVFTLIAIVLLGNVLVTGVRDGLLEAKVDAALVESASGTRAAQEAMASADSSVDGVYDTLIPDLVRQLSRSSGAGSREVLLLRGPDIISPEAPLGRSSFGADIGAATQKVARQVAMMVRANREQSESAAAMLATLGELRRVGERATQEVRDAGLAAALAERARPLGSSPTTPVVRR